EYIVCLEITDSCSSDLYCDSVILFASGISELVNDQLKVFPNPASDKIVIELQNSSGIRDILKTFSLSSVW
ncbi:MAG: hypothetical protein ABIK52_00350, partial [Bacteroidota bacterium]